MHTHAYKAHQFCEFSAPILSSISRAKKNMIISTIPPVPHPISRNPHRLQTPPRTRKMITCSKNHDHLIISYPNTKYPIPNSQFPIPPSPPPHPARKKPCASSPSFPRQLLYPPLPQSLTSNTPAQIACEGSQKNLRIFPQNLRTFPQNLRTVTTPKIKNQKSKIPFTLHSFLPSAGPVR